MEHSQTPVSDAGHFSNRQREAGDSQISQRPCVEAPTRREMEVVALPTPDGENAVRYCRLGRNITPWSEEELKFLANNYRHMTYGNIAEALGRGIAAVKLRAQTLGYKRPRGKTSAPTTFGGVSKPAEGKSERAADFLRAHDRVAMWRCDEKGAANPNGPMWRYGNAILSDQEVLDKATRKGWDVDQWRRIA